MAGLDSNQTVSLVLSFPRTVRRADCLYPNLSQYNEIRAQTVQGAGRTPSLVINHLEVSQTATTALKTVRLERVSGVRIPPPPPLNQALSGLETTANLSGERSLYRNLSPSATCVPQRSATPLGS